MIPEAFEYFHDLLINYRKENDEEGSDGREGLHAHKPHLST